MASKFLFHYKRLGTAGFCRKLIFAINRKMYLNMPRKIRAYFYFRTTSIILGKNVRIHGLPQKVSVGKGTYFYDNCVFEFGAESEACIGSNVVFSYGVVFCCRSSIRIGNDVQIGEYTSIRDSTHRYDVMDMPMKYAEDQSDPVVIADNVWIGRGCLILPGTVIDEGVVVAANSLVKGALEKNGVYGGIPVKLLKYRDRPTEKNKQ